MNTNTNHYCELCDGLGDGTASKYDTDLCMWLCGPCFDSFNGQTESFELSDAEWDM